MKGTIKTLIFLFLCTGIGIGSGCKEEPEEPLTFLKGTKWKLEGIVNEHTGKMQVLEPVDCKKCYTITFISDTEAEGIAFRENISLDLSLLGKYFIQYVNRDQKDDIFVRALYSNNTNSYSATTKYFKFINSIDGYYLLLKKI